MAEPAVKITDEQLFDKVMNPSTNRRGGDPNGAFSKFRTFRDRILKVAVTKGNHQIPVGVIVSGAVNEGLVQDYRRGYNYHSQMIKSLAAGWVVDKVNGKNHYIYTAPKK